MTNLIVIENWLERKKVFEAKQAKKEGERLARVILGDDLVDRVTDDDN
jgi:hypothetical protein